MLNFFALQKKPDVIPHDLNFRDRLASRIESKDFSLL
jgi:hypothetical protein